MARREAPSRRRVGQKQNTFFGGAAILAAGAMVVKLIGMFYKIPLNNIIGAQGNADFNNAYNIYAVLLTISTAGLPVAVSKLVSEANAQGRRNQVRRTFQLALGMFLFLGTVSFLVMYFKADALAGLMNDTKAAPGIRALAPAVVCVGCLAALRGYSQGHLNMTPTSVSQIIEALCKLFIGLSLAYALIKMGQPPEIAAAGAITGVTVGTVVALVYMVVSFFLARLREPGRSRDVPDASGDIIRDILRIAIPITLSSSMVGIVTVIDSSLVQGQVQKALLENPACWELYRSFVDFAPLEGAISAWKELLTEGTAATMAVLSAQAEAAQAAQAAGTALSALEEGALTLHTTLEGISRTLYGNYGSALTIYNLPTALMTAITISVIPTVSGALARPLLSTLGLATVFVCLMLVCNSILQAYGFVNLPILVMVLGGGLKIFTNYNVVAMPRVGIYGAPMGNIFCFGLCLLLDLLLISRVVPRRPRYLPVFLKPLIASAMMGGAAWAVYGLGAKLLSSVPEGGGQAVLSTTGNAICVLAAIGVAVVIYLVLVIALRAISRDDLSLMPKGDKLARLLRL